MEMYKYHNPPIWKPKKLHWKSIIYISNFRKPNQKYNKSRVILNKINWLKTLIYLDRLNLSWKHWYHKAKQYGCDLEDELMIEILKDFKKRKRKGLIDVEKEIIHSFVRYEWNESELFKKFKSKEKVNEYKKSIIKKNSNNITTEKKKSELLNIVDNYPSITRNDLIKKSGFSKNTIDKYLKELNITLNRSNPKIEEVKTGIDKLLKYDEHKINKRLTNKLLAEHFNVSINTVKNFFKQYPEYKLKVQTLNKNIKPVQVFKKKKDEWNF